MKGGLFVCQFFILRRSGVCRLMAVQDRSVNDVYLISQGMAENVTSAVSRDVKGDRGQKWEEDSKRTNAQRRKVNHSGEYPRWEREGYSKQ